MTCRTLVNCISDVKKTDIMKIHIDTANPEVRRISVKGDTSVTMDTKDGPQTGDSRDGETGTGRDVIEIVVGVLRLCGLYLDTGRPITPTIRRLHMAYCLLISLLSFLLILRMLLLLGSTDSHSDVVERLATSCGLAVLYQITLQNWLTRGSLTRFIRKWRRMAVAFPGCVNWTWWLKYMKIWRVVWYITLAGIIAAALGAWQDVTTSNDSIKQLFIPFYRENMTWIMTFSMFYLHASCFCIISMANFAHYTLLILITNTLYKHFTKLQHRLEDYVTDNKLSVRSRLATVWSGCSVAPPRHTHEKDETIQDPVLWADCLPGTSVLERARLAYDLIADAMDAADGFFCVVNAVYLSGTVGMLYELNVIVFVENSINLGEYLHGQIAKKLICIH